jgi:hypothetical protein
MIKHSVKQCRAVLKAIKKQIEKAYITEDKVIRHHYLEDALTLIDQLEREPNE